MKAVYEEVEVTAAVDTDGASGGCADQDGNFYIPGVSQVVVVSISILVVGVLRITE